MWGWGCPQASPQSAAVAGYDDDEGVSEVDDDGGEADEVRGTLLPVFSDATEPGDAHVGAESVRGRSTRSAPSPAFTDAVGQRPTPDAVLREADAKVLHCVPPSDTTSLSTASQNAEPGDAHGGVDEGSDAPGTAGPRPSMMRGTSFTSNDWLKSRMSAARQRTASCAAQANSSKKPKSQYHCGLNTVNVLGR
jgi:hypothetical protein